MRIEIVSQDFEAANAARYCASLLDVFEMSFRQIIAPAKLTVDYLRTSLKDGELMIEFAFYNLPNGIMTMPIGEVMYRGQLVADHDNQSDTGQIVAVVPCETVFAAIRAQVGVLHHSSTFNGYFEGLAVLHERKDQTMVQVKRWTKEFARVDLHKTVDTIVSILMQLPAWDAFRLLDETVRTMDEPLLRERLNAAKADLAASDRNDKAVG